MRHTAYILVLLIGLTTSLLFVGPLSGRAQPVVDHDLYAQLLTQHVRDGVVDYAGLKRQEALLDRYLDQLEDHVPSVPDHLRADRCQLLVFRS